MKNLTPAELAAVGAVDRDRIADDLAALVAVPSVTGDEAAVQTEVALRMTEADGAGDEERPAPPAHGARPGHGARRPAHEVAHGSVEDDRIAGRRNVPAPADGEQACVRHQIADRLAVVVRDALVGVAVDDESGALHAPREVPHVVAGPAAPLPAQDLAARGP